jgi:hypothetical protein
MADGRQTRESQTRATEQRPKHQFVPPQVLPEVPQRDGWEHRWIRTGIYGTADNTNVSLRFREGWEPAPKNEYPEMFVMTDRETRFPDNIEIGGLLLCRSPREVVQARNEYYAKRAHDATVAVDNNLMRENDPRMPLFKEGKSSISFGRGGK